MLSPKNISILAFIISGISLIALGINIGWIFFTVGFVALLFVKKKIAKELSLLAIPIAILGFTPISTSIDYIHFLQLAITVVPALYIPYILSRFVYKDYLVRFNFGTSSWWRKRKFFYLILSAIVAYIFFPLYFSLTRVYLNWPVEQSVSGLVRLFIGLNLLGMWDELFFISTVFGVLRRVIPFWYANIAQAILLSSFLYRIGFKEWGFIATLFFGLMQGYVYKKTNSLLYVIVIHLIFDLFLYFALIHAYYPKWFSIFFF